jgi:hypothetical protein
MAIGGSAMKPRTLLVATTAFLSVLGHTQEKPVYPAPAKPLKAEYTIYSGGLGDEQAPTKNERKLAIEISGQGAKDIFDSLYPDAKVTCSGEQGERLRRRGHLWCSFSPTEGYRCFIGFNLRTGDSIAGGSC